MAEARLKGEFCPAFSPRCIKVHICEASSFSSEEVLNSETTQRGSLCFRLRVYPKGDSASKDTHLSAWVEVFAPDDQGEDWSLPKVDCGICLVNRRDKSQNNMQFTTWCPKAKSSMCGWTSMFPLKKLTDPKLGWIDPADDSMLLYATAQHPDEANAFVQEPEGGVGSILSVVSDLAAMWSEGEHGEVTLVAGGKEMKAHSLVLSARSPVMRKMLESGMLETTTMRIEVSDMSAKTLKQFCVFLYSGVVELGAWVGDDSIVDLIGAGSKYEVADLVSLCEAEGMKRVSLNSVLIWWKVAHQINLERLNSHCIKYAVKHLSNVQSTDAWSELLLDKTLFSELARLLLEAISPPAKKPPV